MNWLEKWADNYFLKEKGMTYSEWIQSAEYYQRRLEEQKSLTGCLAWIIVILVLLIIARMVI